MPRTEQRSSETSEVTERRPNTPAAAARTAPRRRTEDKDAATDRPGAAGVIVVEAPTGASIVINGRERGSGPTMRLRGVDRYAPISIHIEADGYVSWSGFVHLEGRAVVRVRPPLKKRDP